MSEMPYAYTKGPLLGFLQWHYNDMGPPARVRHYERLTARDSNQEYVNDVADCGTLDRAAELWATRTDNTVDTVLRDQTAKEFKKHLNEHWFGRKEAVDGGFLRLQPLSPSNPQTGWWMNWYGDAEQVFRQGLARTLELALGLKRDPTTGALVRDAAGQLQTTRNWPVLFEWVCGPPRFECPVRARKLPNGDGVVIITIITPGMGIPLNNELAPTDETELGDRSLNDDECIWLVGHQQLTDVAVQDLDDPEHWFSVVSATDSSGTPPSPVVTRALSLIEGGIDRQWQWPPASGQWQTP